jgi:hypothetical protein
MQRFHATRFNDRDHAVDAMGIPAPEQACPHCRRRLPPGFIDAPHHIFSIVGAPSSGKSYYLSVLVKMLQTTLFQQFGIAFRDADPSENVILNQMKTQLFSAATPQERAREDRARRRDVRNAPASWTQGAAAEAVHLSSLESARRRDFSIVFYDNAGEHFEPTRNSADSPARSTSPRRRAFSFCSIRCTTRSSAAARSACRTRNSKCTAWISRTSSSRKPRCDQRVCSASTCGSASPRRSR